MPYVSPYASDLDRFLSFTKRDPDTGCLLWMGGRAPSGHGVFYCKGKSRNAHRWIYEMFYDERPEVVMHSCDNPPCVDWERCLRAGTFALNAQDRNAKGRDNHFTKVTDAECDEIRAAVKAGRYQYEVARDYAISPQQVSNIVRGASRVPKK